MSKKVSLLFALVVMIACSLFVFNAYAQEPTDPQEPAVPISITSSNTVVALSSTSYNYDGNAKTPAVTVTFTAEDGNKVNLVKDTDYKVSYSNNINAGTAKVTIEGINGYTGSISKTFTIKPISITGSSFNITLGYGSCGYTGNKMTPLPTIYWTNGGKKVLLLRGDNKDYIATWSNNVNVGQATCTITGIGNFTGTVKKYYKIVPTQVKNFKINSSTANTVTLSWSKLNISGITGYQIVRYDPKQGKYVHEKLVSPDATRYTVTGLTASTAYHFRVRAVKRLSDGSYCYGVYSVDAATATAPVRVTTTSVSKSGTSIALEWTTTKSSGYQIFYSTDSSFKNYKCITLNGATRSSYTIKNVSSSKDYYVKVRAFIRYNDGAHKGTCSPYLSTYYSNLYATYTSSYVSNANRTNNLRIASNAINGTIVKPGETFDFNAVVGPRTSARGYKAAPVFVGTKSVEDGIGGGICQVASTMFNCALYANVGIVERYQHSQRVAYVPLGRDAAISGSAKNFRWKNTTNYPIRVVMTVKDGKITCSFYTSVKTKPDAVSLKVTQSGKNFTLKRTVNGKVNYTAKSNY